VRDIHRSGITLVIVEHIMEVIMSLATRVVVFHGRVARDFARAAAGHTPIELMGGPAT
jgi:branched-chain amino acid transport system ATP-binding protein